MLAWGGRWATIELCPEDNPIAFKPLGVYALSMDKTQLEKAERIHELLSETYWTIRSALKVQRAWCEMDMLIHDIITDYQQRGMQSDGPA